MAPMTVASPIAPPDDFSRWPAIDDAYAFVLPSYQWLVSRFEAADTRLTTLLTLGASVTASAPVFARAVRPTILYGSPWFIGAMLAFCLAAVVGVLGRIAGRITLPNPGVLYAKSLHESAPEFRKNAIYFAGQHFDANARAIARKGQCAIGVTVALLVEVLGFAIWIAR